MLSSKARAISFLFAGVVLAGCADQMSAPDATVDLTSAVARPLGAPGSAADRLLYQVRLGALDGSRSHGVILIEIAGGYIGVTAHAAGLEPSQHIPQHIHVNPTCNPGGGILVNLDANLTVAGEAPGVGAAYPRANRAGVVNYHARRSLSSLRAAVNTHFGAGLASDGALIDWLNLEQRNAHMHVAFGPPFPAVNCGEVKRLN